MENDLSFIFHFPFSILNYPLKDDVVGGARIGDHIADVFHSSEVHDGTLEAEAEAGVWECAESAQVQVTFVGRRIQAVVLHHRQQVVQTLFTLAAADDFADARH